MLSYADSDPEALTPGEFRILNINTMAPTTGTALLMQWTLAAFPADEQVQFHGAPAVVMTHAMGPLDTGTTQVLWLEPDGPFVSVMGIGLTREDVLAVAESTERISDEEWAEMLGAP